MMELIKDCVSFFREGGIFMYPLAACSVLVIAAIIYRMLNMRKKAVIPRRLVDYVERFNDGVIDRDKLAEKASKYDSVLGRLARVVLNGDLNDPAALKENIQIRAREEFVSLQAGMPLLDMIVTIAPMFGILGTASGLVGIFSVFGTNDADGMIAQGIAQALNTTIAGLAIATPAVIAHVYYSRKLERISARMEVLLTELIDACRNPQH